MPEKYTGVKFKVKRDALKRAKVSDERIPEIIKWARILFEKGFAPENSGNISVRKEHGTIIKATGSEFAKLGNKDFVFVEEFDFEKFVLAKATGLLPPSSETPLHLAIYLTRPDVQAIVHCHAFPKGVPETEEEYHYGSIEQAKAVCDLLKTGDIAIAKNHGVFSVGKTVEEAAELILKQA
ncbi:MAG: class II aldolase/adducin family protein [Candidatus Micrarchaeota archaeon]